jgi:hypothetical protein
MAALLRSLNLKPARFQGCEIIARPPLGRRAGKDRHVATAVIVKILDTPLPRTVAIFVDRDLTVERTERGISEVLTLRETRHLGWVLGGDTSSNVLGPGPRMGSQRLTYCGCSERPQRREDARLDEGG